MIGGRVYYEKQQMTCHRGNFNLALSKYPPQPILTKKQYAISHSLSRTVEGMMIPGRIFREIISLHGTSCQHYRKSLKVSPPLKVRLPVYTQIIVSRICRHTGTPFGGINRIFSRRLEHYNNYYHWYTTGNWIFKISSPLNLPFGVKRPGRTFRLSR